MKSIVKLPAKDYPAAVRLFEAAKKEETTAQTCSWDELDAWKQTMYARLAHAVINKS